MIEEKFKLLMNEIDSYKKKIFDFDKDKYDFIPAHHNPKEEGYNSYEKETVYKAQRNLLSI